MRPATSTLPSRAGHARPRDVVEPEVVVADDDDAGAGGDGSQGQNSQLRRRREGGGQVFRLGLEDERPG